MPQGRGLVPHARKPAIEPVGYSGDDKDDCGQKVDILPIEPHGDIEENKKKRYCQDPGPCQQIGKVELQRVLGA